MSRAEARARIIEDSTTGDNLKVNPDGSINVAGQVISVPPNTTEVDQNVFGSVSSTTGVDTIYVIPNGETLTIQQLSGGAEEHTSGSIIELFEDPNGNLSVLNRIETVFVNGDSRQVTVQREFVGDGTRRIILRRRRYASNAKEIWGRWRGYTE